MQLIDSLSMLKITKQQKKQLKQNSKQNLFNNVKMYGVVAAINRSHIVSKLNKLKYEKRIFKN